MPITINGSGSIDGLSVGGLGSGVVNTATLANGAATGVKLGTGSVIQTVSSTFAPYGEHIKNYGHVRGLFFWIQDK